MNTSSQLLERLEQLNRIGVGLSRERNIDRLLEDILLAAKGITGADGGTLYRMNEAGTQHRPGPASAVSSRRFPCCCGR